MKPVAFLVSTLATLAVAAPAAPATGLEERAFEFDINAFNGLQSFNQVNLNYLLNINSLQLGLLGNLASVNNLNILQFQPLFQHQAFDIQGLLQLQALHTFLQIGQLGVLNGFDLASLQLQHLNLGLLNNVGIVDLQQFVAPNVVPQVQTIAAEAAAGNPALVVPGVGVGNSTVPAAALSSAPANGTAQCIAPGSGGSESDSNVVTEAEQEAQEGSSSLN